jgi:hypothetical protein
LDLSKAIFAGAVRSTGKRPIENRKEISAEGTRCIWRKRGNSVKPSSWMWYRALEESQGFASYMASREASRQFVLARVQSTTLAGQRTRDEISAENEREMISKLLQIMRPGAQTDPR